ncbi:MAG TPA: S8 family serine peptidase [Gemmatimonas sp.]|uniref:S8 family serine peptidase n=1 Tax=Gemmatimonas sp. TaxID=1962908 RepID=UPI002EDA60FF
MSRAIALSLILSATLGACARAGAPPAQQPAPSGQPTQPVVQPPMTVTPAPPPAAAPDSARADWHRLDAETDGVIGVGSERALRELLAGRAPQRSVVVAVIDGGVDTVHRYLAPSLWKNPKEVAGNGRDDDNNGFVDDVFGWNFSVMTNGESVHHDTFEVTRLYAACGGQAAGAGIPKPAQPRCDSVRTAYREQVEKVTGTLGQIRNIERTLSQVNDILRQAIPGEITRARVETFKPTNAMQEQARGIWLQLAENGLDAAAIAEAKEAYESQARYGLDTLFAPHATAPSAGARDIMGPDAKHGSHVAGIIGAVRGAGNPVQGIAPNVRLMGVRAVPDGDERDPDIARAVRYAVDNGAQIINMSFGKAWSPQKATVDSAMRYAASKGVLLVHAAGNDAENNDVSPSFPTSVTVDGARVETWIEVGASSWKGKDKLAAGFSNYGKARVDLFAPGEDILSTVPGGGVKRESGTSMAAPVVSGVAALLMAYFPNLTATQVKEILLQSVRKFPGQQVDKPGGEGQRVAFDALSATGGIVDAYAAVKLALQRIQ